MEARSRVTADVETCVGTGQCEITFPEGFAVGDNGVVAIDADAVAHADPKVLRRVVRNCPTAALRLVE